MLLVIKQTWFLTYICCNYNAVIAFGEFVTKLSQFAFSNQSFAVRGFISCLKLLV